MKKVTYLMLTAALAASLVATTALQAAEPKAAGGGEALEALLKAAKIDYSKVGDKAFKIAIDDKDGNSTNIIVELREIDLDGPKPYVFVWSIIQHLDGDKLPEPILAKLAQFNENLKFGNLSVAKEKNGGQTIYLNFSCFLKNLDADQLFDFLKMNYGTRLVVRKELQRINEEGAGEK